MSFINDLNLRFKWSNCKCYTSIGCFSHIRFNSKVYSICSSFWIYIIIRCIVRTINTILNTIITTILRNNCKWFFHSWLIISLIILSVVFNFWIYNFKWTCNANIIQFRYILAFSINNLIRNIINIISRKCSMNIWHKA